MTYYEVLQVVNTASPEVIQMAYKALARKYHPDVYQGDKDFAERKMKQINEAYRILSSPVLRREYDQKLSARERTQNEQYTNKAEPRPQYSPHVQKEPQHSPQQAQDTESLLSRIRTFAKTHPTLIFIILMIAIPLALISFEGTLDKIEEQNNPPVNPPRSGAILSGYEYYGESEITVTASSYEDCVVKLKTGNDTTVISFYVRAGDTVTIGVPNEYLYVYFASGDTWFGKEKLFGKSTQYSKDADVCDFSSYTYEYTLKETDNGNFDEEPIDAEEFN